MDVFLQSIPQNKSLIMDCMVILCLLIKILQEIVTLEFHLIFILDVPCQILHGIAPDEYKCEKLLPFFYANGSTVFILVSFADGNSVKPVFFSGKYYYLCTIFTPGLGIDIGFVYGLFVVVVVEVGLIVDGLVLPKVGFCIFY